MASIISVTPSKADPYVGENIVLYTRFSISPGGYYICSEVNGIESSCGFAWSSTPRTDTIDLSVDGSLFKQGDNKVCAKLYSAHYDDIKGRWVKDKLLDQKCITITARPKPAQKYPKWYIEIKADKTTVTVGDDIKITTTVHNIGNASGTIQLDLFINGVRQYLRRTLLVDPGKSLGEWWLLSFDKPGTYKVCVKKVSGLGTSNEACLTITVTKPTPPPTVKIIKFDVKPTEVNVGEEVKATAVLIGTPNSTWIAELYVNGNKVDKKSITLSYDGKGTAYFTVSFNYAGEYNVKVCLGGGSMAVCSSPKTVVVKEKKIGAKPEITYFDVSPKEVEEGGSVTVTANVRNSGDTAGTFKIYTVVNGSPLEGTEKLVTLKPGSQHTYKKTLEMTSAGSYSVSVCAEVL